jgi:NADH-quinone oxidoreductase subunit E
MYFTKPVGKHVLEVCRTGPCALLGSDKTLSCLQKKLGIKEGETTPDGKFTLKTVECLACCGTGPIVQVGEDYHENVTEENVETWLKKFS